MHSRPTAAMIETTMSQTPTQNQRPTKRMCQARGTRPRRPPVQRVNETEREQPNSARERRGPARDVADQRATHAAHPPNVAPKTAARAPLAHDGRWDQNQSYDKTRVA